MRTILATLHSKFIHNSLALPCLASYCGEACGELLIREFTTHEPREAVLAMLLAEDPDVIAFSVYLWNRRETLDLVDALAVARPTVKLVLGGPEVSFDDPKIFERHPGLTALIRGEGEEPLRTLLHAWHNEAEAQAIPRTLIRSGEATLSGPDSPPLAELDAIPSPFRAGLVDLSRGFVYYETSRGCPYRCSFCLSARDDRVRSYSMERIQSDLLFLMENEVAKVKLVDRTFNYDAARARKIFRFILAHNRATHFHFEIGAHLLDAETLDLLADVPRELFQFEIGVQSTLEETLDAIDRKVSLASLEANVRRLIADERVHLHLDLIAGLPGESYADFIASVDRVLALNPHHLQIEPVKLLPGSPLREQAAARQIGFDPNPPYTILGSPELSYSELQRIQQLGRLLDLIYNSGCFANTLRLLASRKSSMATALTWLTEAWDARNLFRFPASRQAIFFNLAAIIRETFVGDDRQALLDGLGYDYARCERVVTNRIPDFFDTDLAPAESRWVREVVDAKAAQLRGRGIKLQYFACRFASQGNAVRLFLYLTQTGKTMQVEEQQYPVDS